MNTINIEQHLAILGLRVKDKVTGQQGVVTSVAFDLYGCVQTIVNPGADKDGKLMEQLWFDIARLDVQDPNPVMAPPNFESGAQAEGFQGAAEKPRLGKA